MNILDLEKSLFKYNYMSNIDYLNSIIDDQVSQAYYLIKKML